MELRQLHYFATLADELHFRRAAERVHIAQPAFSEQIRRLEDELGARLFDRTSHYVRLTEAGTLFLGEIRPALLQLKSAAAIAGRAGRGVFGTLALGLSAAVLNELTPLILREFASRCPDVAVELREYGFGDSSAGLAGREVDVSLFRLPVAGQQELEVVRLHDEPRVAVLPSEHPLADAILLTATDLADETLVTGPRPVALREPRPLEPVADTLETWLSLIAAGCGIGLAPASTERLHGRSGLRFVAITGIADTTLAIAHRHEVTVPAVREFVKSAQVVAERAGCTVRADRVRRRPPSRASAGGDRADISHETDLVLAADQPSGHDLGAKG
jgi:DNA-binding transcriptional LysR family regulator